MPVETPFTNRPVADGIRVIRDEIQEAVVKHSTPCATEGLRDVTLFTWQLETWARILDDMARIVEGDHA